MPTKCGKGATPHPIIAVPTALTGFFGQNVPYWGYEKFWGFLLSLGLIVGSAAGLYLYLKRRGWL